MTWEDIRYLHFEKENAPIFNKSFILFAFFLQKGKVQYMLHYKITVKGCVQGVFYRASTKEEALKLGLKGYVRNLPNGDVLIEAEGDKEQLDKLVNWCHTGPPLSEVTEVLTTEGDVIGFSLFEIRK